MIVVFYRIIFWLAVALTPVIFVYNSELFFLLNCRKGGGGWDTFFLLLTSLADGLWIAMIVAIVQSLYPKNFGVFILALIIGNILLHGGKFLFDADRPLRILGEAKVCVLGQPLTVRSFPSGHSFAAMTLFMFVRPTRSLPLAVLVLGLSVLAVLSRAYVGAHFPRDMITGALIAVVSYLAAERLILKFKPWSWPTYLRKFALSAVGLATALAYIFLYHEKTKELEYILTPAAWLVVAYWVMYGGFTALTRIRQRA